MFMRDKIKIVKEGSAKIIVPNVEKVEDSRSNGFYNPAMKNNRDLSIIIAKRYKELYNNNPKILDAFTATGIRAIRYFKEVNEDVTACDVNEKAFSLAKKNAEINAAKIRFFNSDWRNLNEGFDIIDIDPYGSPCGHIDKAFQILKTPGMLFVTATDTAVLNGVYPNISLRRYGVKSIHSDFAKELATRILISFIIREGAKYDRAFTPVLSIQERHYVRIFGLVKKGAEMANHIMEKFNFLSHCSCGYREIGIKLKCPKCKKNMKVDGPYYFGNLHDKDFLKNINHKLIQLSNKEINTPLFYDVHKICKKYKKVPRKMNDIINDLKNNGFLASRTLFSPTGIKSNCSIDDLLSVI